MDDPSYKRLLEHQRIVKDLLIGFIAPRRPAGWAAALDFDTLREGATENVTDELRRRLGDVVWSIDRRDGRGGVQTLHLLLEHQLSVDYSMPLRFLNYTSLLYQRLYGRGGVHDNAGGTPAARASVQRGLSRGALPERMRELGEWLAAEGEPGLTRTFDLWLGALGRKWGVALPSIREYEEVSAVLANKIDRWEAEILQRGIEQGIEQEKTRLHRLAERRFGAAAAARLAAALAGVTDADRLAAAGEWIVDCATTADFLARVGRAGS